MTTHDPNAARPTLAETHYKGSRIAVLDGGLHRSLPDADYLVVPYAGGHAVMSSDGTMMSGSTPLPDVNQAVAVAHSLIDDMLEHEAKYRESALEAPVGSEPVPRASNPLFGDPLPTTPLPVPLQLVIDLYNAVPPESPTRSRLLEALKQVKDHAVAGLHLDTTGNLLFDARRYSIQVYRAKQERKAEHALRLLKDAALELSAINEHLQHECDVAEMPAAEGTPLTPLRAPAAQLLTVGPALQTLLMGMRNVDALAGERPHAPPEPQKGMQPGSASPAPNQDQPL